jgi:hypothetical protein
VTRNWVDDTHLDLLRRLWLVLDALEPAIEPFVRDPKRLNESHGMPPLPEDAYALERPWRPRTYLASAPTDSFMRFFVEAWNQSAAKSKYNLGVYLYS